MEAVGQSFRYENFLLFPFPGHFFRQVHQRFVKIDGAVALRSMRLQEDADAGSLKTVFYRACTATAQGIAVFFGPFSDEFHGIFEVLGDEVFSRFRQFFLAKRKVSFLLWLRGMQTLSGIPGVNDGPLKLLPAFVGQFYFFGQNFPGGLGAKIQTLRV